MTSLSAFLHPLKDFESRPAPEQLQLFAWYLHEVRGLDRVSSSDLAACFDEMHLPRPANTASSLSKLCERRPPRFLRDSRGYRLSAEARKDIAIVLPVRPTATQATRLLTDLVNKLPTPAQRVFLEETIACFGNKAYRSSIVMAWNLAFSDVLDRIFATHLAAFNSQVGTHGFKSPVVSRSDFADMREADIIKIARAAKIISGETQKTLVEKLGKRNTSAHPSDTVISTSTAEEVIFDLVQNVVLKPTL